MDIRRYRSVAAGKRLPEHMRKRSLLDAKIEIAEQMLHECVLCERRCRVDRTKGETGFCGVTDRSHFFFEQILWGEEAPLVPSHEVFFSGCNMRCGFCYSWEALLNASKGTPIVPEDFAALVDRRHAEGAVNLNLIGGEPTVHLPNILKSLKLLQSPTAIVWNSNFYMSTETMRLLDGIVDLYVGDMRFGNNDCASRIADTDRYFDVARRNFASAAMSGDLIIRHLLLPGHVECCLRPSAEWAAENLPGVPFNLMFQYTPFFKALDDPELCRTLTQDERDQALDIVRTLGLNTERWNRPLRQTTEERRTGSGDVATTVIVGPDGQVSVMHLHEDLLQVVKALEDGGISE